jgi:ribosomal protein L18E
MTTNDGQGQPPPTTELEAAIGKASLAAAADLQTRTRRPSSSISAVSVADYSATLNVVVTRIEQMARVLEDEYHSLTVVLGEIQTTARLMQTVIGEADQLQSDQRSQIERLGIAVAALAKLAEEQQQASESRSLLR